MIRDMTDPIPNGPHPRRSQVDSSSIRSFEMFHLASLPMPSATQLISVLTIKLVALMVAVSMGEDYGRRVIPIAAVIYAVLLPVVLYLTSPVAMVPR